MQPDPLSPQQENQSGTPPVQGKKSPKLNLTSIVLIILVLVVAGLGFWGYQLNSKLATTQQELTTLQAKYDKLQDENTKLQSDYAKLKSDDEKLAADFNQSKADLEKTSVNLTTAQADLKKSQDQNDGLKTKVTAASKKAEILYAYSVVKTADEFLAIDSLIKATKDDELLKEWNNFISAPSTDTSLNFLLYLIGSIQDDLK